MTWRWAEVIPSCKQGGRDSESRALIREKRNCLELGYHERKRLGPRLGNRKRVREEAAAAKMQM